MKASMFAVILVAVFASVTSYGQRAWPPDVEQFVQRRDLCDHFRGEEPYDADRRKFLEQRMLELCTGTDEKLAALKRKYQKQSDILTKLNQYEANIEAR